MSEKTTAFVGDIPKHYDGKMGPIIFDHMAMLMAQKAAARTPRNVLEIAAGTGIVTDHLSRVLGDGTRIIATDLNEPMLDIARAKLDGTHTVAFQPADALDLPFDDGAFDMVVCQFGHMFFPDRARAYAEARRVLRSGGYYLFTTWGTNSENPYSELVNETLADAFMSDPPGFMKMPFSLNDAQKILRELEPTGFVDVVHEVADHSPTVASYDEFALGLMLGSPAFFEVNERGGDHGEIARDLAVRMRARFGNEPSATPLKAHFFAMVAP